MPQVTLSQFLKTEELDIQSANASLFVMDLAFSSFADAHVKHGVNFAPVFCYINCQNSSPAFQITPQENIRKIHEKFYGNYIRDAASFRNFIDKEKNLIKEADIIWAAYKKSKQKLKNLAETYNRLLLISREWFMCAVIGEDKGTLIEDVIIPRFAENHDISLAKAHSILDVLVLPSQQSEFNLERIEFLKLCLYALRKKYISRSSSAFHEDKIFKKLINSYIKKYFWTKIDYCHVRDITPQDIFEEVKKETKGRKEKEINNELNNIIFIAEDLFARKKKLLTKIKLSQEEKKDILFAQLMFYWMDQRKMLMMKLFFYLISGLEDAAKIFNLTHQEIPYYRAIEIEAFLNGGKRIEKKVLKNRKSGIFMIFEREQKFHAFYGKEGKKLFDLATARKKQDVLKGKIASAGGQKKITGKICVVHDPKKEKFSEGDILVTSMTRVEFVPLMRKAKAIVTNEGGIACHAAIISRELDKPCIIGTHSATKILKTGDKVEMDMVSGEIKVL